MIVSHSSHVFLSYARADASFVSRLQSDLQAGGIAVWIDHEDIQPGTPDWEDSLRKAIRHAAAVVLVASPSARSSRYVKDELRIAEMYRRPVYPLWAMGDEWMDAVPIGWGGTQYIDAREGRYQEAIHELVMILEKLNSPAGAADAKPEPSSLQSEPPRNPYKGLHAFRREDAGDFFGRSRFINALVEALQKQLATEEQGASRARLLTVIGSSGSGKSSVVMAGLLPQLQRGVLAGSQGWVYIEPMAPGQHPIEALTLALSPSFPARSLKAIREDVEDDTARGLHLLMTTLVAQPDRKVLLLIDQFEELFTQTVDENERKRFIDLLITAITEPRGPVIAILTFRADFYDRPLSYPELGQLIESHHMAVFPMEMSDLREVIEKPAQLPDVRLTFEGDLVGDLLFEVQGQAGALPLLQFTLDQLFQRRKGRQLTTQAYREIGGVKGALANHAEATYASLPSEDHRRLARALFLRLVDPGTTEQDMTRRRVAFSELEMPDPQETATLKEVVKIFTTARLLVTNTVAGVSTVEVSHEALMREWKLLADWIHEAREDIQLRKAISEDAMEWKRRGYPLDRLYRGSQLSEALAWRERNSPSIDEEAFLSASIAERERQETEEQERQRQEEQQQKKYTRRIVLVGLGGLGLTMATVTVSGFFLSLKPSEIIVRGSPEVPLARGGTYDSDLQVTFQTLQSSFKILPVAPSAYTLGTATPNDAQLIATSQSLPYRVVLKIHSLQQGRYGLVIDQVALLINKQAQVIPYPLRVVIENNVSTYNNNLYRVTYRGQEPGALLTALYMEQPLGVVSLVPGETDEISLEVRSTVVVGLHFQVQVTYHVIGELASHTLTLPNIFEIIFSDQTNWHPYQIQAGHLVVAA